MFNHLLDERQRNWGGYDRWPQETANTVLWHPGEVVSDTFNLPIDTAAPPGVYTVDIGLYNQADSTAAPLPLVREGIVIDQNSVRIGPVKIGAASPGIVLPPDQVKPEVTYAVPLGQPAVILGRGYNLNHNDDSLELTLFWESLAQTPVDWSIFVHLRDRAGQIVAQKDGPAGGGYYPTSLWDSGEILTDEITIPLPTELPAGEYSLVVGLYNLADGMRLTVPNSRHNEINLTTWVQLDSP